MGDSAFIHSAEMQVQKLNKKVIKPSSPTPPHLQNYKLSFFDQLAPRAHVPLVYFYHIDDDSENTTKFGQLQISLSKNLNHFYPLAGRFSEDGLSVNCQDQGILYVEAEVNRRLDQFLKEANENIDLVSKFVPWDIGETCHVTTPIIGVQITTFECGGLALAVHNTHTLSDGFTGTKFTDEWAKISRSDYHVDEQMSLNFNLASIFPARDDISQFLKPFPPIKPGPKVVTKMFMFNEAAILGLKDKVRANLAGTKFHPSRVEVVTALIWRGMIRASQARHGRLRPSITSLAVNLRGKNGLGAADNSFGNLYIQVPIKFSADKVLKELHDFVQLLRGTIQKTLADCGNASSADEIFSVAVNFHNEIREGVGDDEVDVRICTSLCRFPIYDADFGWGKPVWVSSTNAPFEIFSLMDTKCGTGVEARVNLNEIDMPIFETDPDIVAFSVSS
ncbi:hypothetical protein ACH5RR_039416 [Cinchona calisaya]|uniref:Uncharacterized protein n=1 Tax=Cinchona calisaya TaxID=153742 RepID=A0ABD2XYN8_9GENT